MPINIYIRCRIVPHQVIMNMSMRIIRILMRPNRPKQSSEVNNMETKEITAAELTKLLQNANKHKRIDGRLFDETKREVLTKKLKLVPGMTIGTSGVKRIVQFLGMDTASGKRNNPELIKLGKQLVDDGLLEVIGEHKPGDVWQWKVK